MPAHGTILRPLVVLAPSSQSGLNIHTAAVAAGMQATGTDIIVNVESGIVLSGSLRTGTGWPLGCTISINVKSGGIIGGGGGAGGHGGNDADGSGGAPCAGGPGVYVEDSVKVFISIVGTGFIAGGGGGGAGGAAKNGPPGIWFPGGGGGGGMGFPGGAAGAHGSTASGDASDGTAGTTATNGSGGDGYSIGGVGGAQGGDGGGLAGDGADGGNTVEHTGGFRGIAGAAIYSVGFVAATITAGNDSAHIKGLLVG